MVVVAVVARVSFCCCRLFLLLLGEFSGFVKGLGWVCGVGRRIRLVLCRVVGRNLRFRCGLDG